MNTHLWPNFIDTLKHEVVPALGCTEPVSVALAAAIAREKLNDKIELIKVFVSPNLMKNGMGVGIPGTGKVGLPIAAAMGAIAGDANAGLEVLANITDSDVIQGQIMIDNHQISIEIEQVPNVLYAKVTLFSGSHSVSVTIADTHTNVVRIDEDGVCIFHQQNKETYTQDSKNIFLDVALQDVYDFSLKAPISDIDFIYQAYEINNTLSEEGLNHDYGLQIGATFKRNMQRGLLSDDALNQVVARTAAASDARMDGAMLPAMSNSGSGNQGITATMPVVAIAEHQSASKEALIRALILSHLTAIYIKKQQNKLSALCGATTASMGAAAGITWLLGGDYEKVSFAISSMIGDIAGIICDGAKTSCAMKVSSSASSAFKAALLALDGKHVTGNEGIVCDSVDASIKNLSSLANGAMTKTDDQIIEIMVNK